MAIDQETLMRLLTSEQGKLRAYSWSLTRDDHLVEEIVQDMAVIAIQKHGQIQDAAHFPAWARTTCRNLAMDAMRKKRRPPHTISNTVLDLLDNHWKRLDGVDPSDMAARLRKCIGRLTSRARQLIECRYVEGMRPGEIAKRLNAKAGTIYVALLRIHHKLAECVKTEQREGGQDG
jgi:RNA polymerase sigma-70 factor, ECF subfamily